MPSLRQLLARHSLLLVIDTGSTRTQVAVWDARAGGADGRAISPRAAQHLDGEASSALPETLARLLAETGLKPGDFAAAAFCAGPGSVLGIRLAAATLRAWRALRPGLELYSFQSLPLLATSHPGLAVAADARRESWHVVQPAAPRDLTRLSSAELASLGAVGTPANFRRWSAPPAGMILRELPYDAPALLAAAPVADLFAEAPEPEAFMGEAPAYATWTPRVHQAPAQ